jgi:hypothetical protein
MHHGDVSPEIAQGLLAMHFVFLKGDTMIAEKKIHHLWKKGSLV